MNRRQFLEGAAVMAGAATVPQIVGDPKQKAAEAMKPDEREQKQEFCATFDSMSQSRKDRVFVYLVLFSELNGIELRDDQRQLMAGALRRLADEFEGV